jgi:hypothetical protein
VHHVAAEQRESAMSGTGVTIAAGIIVLIEVIVVWRIARALNRGVIKIDPLFWLTDTWGLEVTLTQARNPFWYWFSIVITAIIGLFFLVILKAIVTGNVH